jgi:hypothetical protein
MPSRATQSVCHFDKSKSTAKKREEDGPSHKPIFLSSNASFIFEPYKGSNRKQKSPRADRAILLECERSLKRKTLIIAMIQPLCASALIIVLIESTAFVAGRRITS